MPVKSCTENIEAPLCKCGCRNQVKWSSYESKWNNYIKGHGFRGQTHSVAAKNRMTELKMGHITSEDTKMKISQKLIGRDTYWMKDRIVSEETRQKLRNINIGKRHSEETKRKLSAALKGRMISEETRQKLSLVNKGQTPWNKGERLSEEHRIKISDSNKGKQLSEKQRKALLSWKLDPVKKRIVSKRISKTLVQKYSDIEERIKLSCSQQGILRENWTHFVSCDPYCQDWIFEIKEMIKERDDYQCQNPDCRENTDRLAVHHIDYNKMNCKPENLITLCTSCNSRANANREFHTQTYRRIANAC